MPISESGNGPVIRTEGLRKDYQMGPTSVQALRGVDLAVPRGEMIAIMGASGSGKSTLMNILGALDEGKRDVVDIAVLECKLYIA